MGSNSMGILALAFLCFSCLMFSVQSKEINGRTNCKATEREALSRFKEMLVDPSNLLSSWTGENCCRWKGISCSNETGHVIKINVRKSCNRDIGILETQNSSCIGGQISSSLLDLKYLNYLDLSFNDFHTPIPQFLGSLEMLSYLDLSSATFIGMVPPHLGNLSNLQYLDLSSNYFLGVSDMFWMSGLTSLEHLDMGYLNLSLAASHWLQALNFLPSLSEMHLHYSHLQNLPQSLPTVNFTCLSVIDLPSNEFNSSIPQWFSNLSSLVTVNLSQNQIKGDINELIGDLAKGCRNSLEKLDLTKNKIDGQLTNSLALLKSLGVLSLLGNAIFGPIPSSIGNLTNLKVIDVSYNQMNGSIPESINKLTNLEELSLFENNWHGILSQNQLQDLKKLVLFSFSSMDRNVILTLSDDWLALFSLKYIVIKGCSLGPNFPAWVRSQKQLSIISLIDVGISDILPDWFWSFSLELRWCDLSNNEIKGILPPSLLHFPDLHCLNLAGNLFSGSIPSNIGQALPSVNCLNLSGNNLSGSIPYSIGEMKELISLDLSINKLSGEIDEDCWRNLEKLAFLDLSMNHLSGSFPRSLLLQKLEILKLNDNNLFGDLSLFPFSVNNASNLALLDLGGNQFSGKILNWFGKMLFLSKLRLRDNMFSGSIPEELCSLGFLQFLDIALNNLSGRIPACIGNLTALPYDYISPIEFHLEGRHKLAYIAIVPMEVVLKGREMVYTNTLKFVNVLDFSNNNFTGEIPREITRLSALGTLNLSRNHLTGHIPEEIGALHLLETLDLSCNHLSGPIPPSMTLMTFLNHLNLSKNNLSGPIPSANQFSTLNDPSIYNGNPELCGSPLQKKCGEQTTGDGKDRSPLTDGQRQKDLIDNEKFGFFVSMGFGFIFGFWTAFGFLAIHKPWRLDFFSPCR